MFLAFASCRFISYRAFIEREYSILVVTAFEKLRPMGKALLMSPGADWGVGDSG